MKVHHLLLLCSLFSPLSFAGHGVGGGGIAENNILYVFSELESFIDLCLHTSDCNLNANEILWLKGIKKSLPAERKNEKLIQFRSEKLEPGFFVVEGQVRIAKTGYEVGNPIFFNVDLLYSGNKENGFLPSIQGALDIPQAASLLIHELGHHQGVSDHLALDVLGSKIHKLSRVLVRELDGGRDHKFLQLASFDYGLSRGSQLIAKDSEKYWILGTEILNKIHCANGGQVKDWLVWNHHWQDVNDLKVRKNLVEVVGALEFSCSGSTIREQRKIHLAFSLGKTSTMGPVVFLGMPEIRIE